VKKYALAYPVATRHDGIYAGIGIVDLLLPYNVWKGKLPEKYVLFRERAYKAGVRVSSDHSPFLSPFGIAGDQNWVWSRRSVIDRRGEVPVVWTDAPTSLERDAHLFVELAVLQIPFIGGNSSDGTVEGRVWRIDPEKLGVVGADGEPIFERMVSVGDFDEVDRIAAGPPKSATSEFERDELWWNLLFANWRTRTSDESIVVHDADGNPIREEHQNERRNRFSWSLLDNGETQEYRVMGFLGSDGGGGFPSEPVAIVQYTVDDLNTHSDEFDSYYALLDDLGGGETLLAPDFRARDWEVSGEPGGRWTRMIAEGTVELHGPALQRLTEIDPAGYWPLLASRLGMTPDELERERALTRASADKSTLVARRSPKKRPLRSLIRRSTRVLDQLAAAGRESDPVERLRMLVKALYLSSYRYGDTFNPIVLATMLEQSGVEDLVDADAMRVDARFKKAFKDEQNMPDGRDVVGRLGERPRFEQVRYRFFPFDGIDLYNMLNWVSETE
jgi:hypothetical protein